MGAHRSQSWAFAVALALLGSALAGCSVSAGSPASDVNVSDGPAVELVIGEELTSQSGVAPESISCPGELAHEEGKRYECTVVHPTEGEQIIDVTMRAPSGFTWLVRG